MGNGVEMFFQLTALMFSCFKGMRRLAVTVTVTVNVDMLYAHIIERETDPLLTLRVFTHLFLYKCF